MDAIEALNDKIRRRNTPQNPTVITSPPVGWTCSVCGVGNAPWVSRCACKPLNQIPWTPYIPLYPAPSHPTWILPWDNYLTPYFCDNPTYVGDILPLGTKTIC